MLPVVVWKNGLVIRKYTQKMFRNEGAGVSLPLTLKNFSVSGVGVKRWGKG